MSAISYLQWRTIAHELGHTLALRHGGNNQDAHKAAAIYQSLMSYTHQLEPTSTVNSYSNSSDPTFDDWSYIKLDFQNSLVAVGNSFRKDIPNYHGDNFEEQVVPLDVISPGDFAVTDVSVNGGDSQRSRITSIDVYFNDDSNLSSLIASGDIYDAVQIHALSIAPGEVDLSAGSHFAWDDVNFRLEIDLTVDGFGGSTVPLLQDDNYELRLNTADIEAAVQARR